MQIYTKFFKNKSKTKIYASAVSFSMISSFESNCEKSINFIFL